MNIEKRYWKWDQKLNDVEFKLGVPIEDLLAKGLVKKSDQENGEYTGIDGIPWKIEVENEIITSIFYRERFFSLLHLGIWDLELGNFEDEVNRILQPVNEDGEGDKLVVVFRESFVAIAGLVSFQRK